MAQPKHTLTQAEYLTQSEIWELRHEWVNGQAYAMSGGTSRHAAVGNNLAFLFRRALQQRPCRPTSGDQRVFIPTTDAYLYPDLSVICGKYEYAPGDPHSIVNPAVVIEVLSPSTRSYDLGAKFEHYRTLQSLRHYLLVDAESPHVIHHQRTDLGWLRRDLHDGDLGLADLEVSIPVAEIYADLDAL